MSTRAGTKCRLEMAALLPLLLDSPLVADAAHHAICHQESRCGCVRLPLQSVLHCCVSGPAELSGLAGVTGSGVQMQRRSAMLGSAGLDGLGLVQSVADSRAEWVY